MSESRRVSLVGLPGSGKSTVGRHLARRLGWGYLDSDTVIEKRIGMPIRAFFEASGEEAFRDVEQQVIDELTLAPENRVLATGGGAVLRAANRSALHERTTVVYLKATPEELHRRLKHDTQRPLLQVDDPQGKLRELYAARDPWYQDIAHFVIETGRPTVHSQVNMVMMQLELAGIAKPSFTRAKPGPKP